MENNIETPVAVVETTDMKKKCKCCGKELPINQFRTYGKGYRLNCINCERKEAGVSERFKDFTSRELMEELRSRGYKGTLSYVKIEKITI